ncbi:MAG: hypothetical protein KDH91_21870, partial [Rhodoferax sp.]|nr:hypothetical protein [Rhodoferax sp.]
MPDLPPARPTHKDNITIAPMPHPAWRFGAIRREPYCQKLWNWKPAMGSATCQETSMARLAPALGSLVAAAGPRACPDGSYRAGGR